MTSTPRRSGVVLIVVGMLAVLLLMMAVNLRHALPMATWWQAVANPETDDLRQLLFHYSLLPRVALSLLVGAGLGLAGLLFQQVLRNPLAEPATLGIATGAQLGVTVATLTVGPLSFVGLMAPHLARMMGFSRVIPQLCCSALIGGILMLLADWAGRMILFPNQVPAGLLATFIGAPYFIYLLRKQAH